MKKVLFLVLLMSCGRIEVNQPKTDTSPKTGTEVKPNKKIEAVTKDDSEDERSNQPVPVTGSAKNKPKPNVDSEVDVKVDVDVKVKVGTTYQEDQQLNYYVLPQTGSCISLNRFDQKGRQLYSRWPGASYLVLYSDNSCWPNAQSDIYLKWDQSITVCQKNLLGDLICNLIWVLEVNPNTYEMTIREFLNNLK